MKSSILPIILMITIVCFATNIAPAFDISAATIYRTAADAAPSSLPGPPQENNFICGDVNEDGFVNVLDIISLVNYIMGGNPSPFDLNAADINADGGINVLDIIALVNIIMEVPGIPCPCNPTVDYEGQVYHTVQIDGQCWFKENLNAGTMILSSTGGQLQTNNGIMEKYCLENNAVNCDTYGGLYEWSEAMQYVTAEGTQGICPAGWHIPKDNELKILEGTVDSQYPAGDPVWDIDGWRGYDAGGNLKETGTTHWISPNTGATNSSGFTALPSGIRSRLDGNVISNGEHGFFWSSSLIGTDQAWGRKLANSSASVDRIDAYILGGLSVRCLKNCDLQPTQANAGPDQPDIYGTSATLAGNTPATGTGQWYILSGTGGTIVTPSSPISEFQGLADHSYTLTWRICTNCTCNEDTVIISFAPPGPPCPGIPVITYEGQTYPTVLIGNQCWFRENLNVGTMILSNAGGQLQTDNGTIEKYCYNNEASNCDIYGGLYEWNEAMQYVTTIGAQGICPDGWHISTGTEWTTLTDFLGGNNVAGGKMKTTGTFEDGTGLWFAPNTGATNESGFSALPGGYRVSDGSFNSLGPFGSFWTSVMRSAGLAWYDALYHDNTNVNVSSGSMNHGFSVRCIIDCWPLPSQADAGPDQINIPGTSTNLGGNTPTYGTGLWTIISGTGGTIVSPSSPNSEFQGVAGNSYILTWTISTICDSSVDTVVISFAAAGFTCGDALIDDRDGQSYATVQIGDQCWMAENLNTGIKINSTAGGFQQFDNDVIEKYCYTNSISQCEVYGGLYEWTEAMQYDLSEGGQGICPAGWHIPTDGEITILSGFLGGETIAGGKMKEEGYNHWCPPNTGATNESGFTELPGGYRSRENGNFYYLCTDGYFWSSTEGNANSAWYRRVNNPNTVLGRGVYYWDIGYSVRCIMD